MVGRLNSHPIVIVPLWEGAPTSDSEEWTVDLCNYLLNDLGELANLIYLYIYIVETETGSNTTEMVGWITYTGPIQDTCIHFCI